MRNLATVAGVAVLVVACSSSTPTALSPSASPSATAHASPTASAHAAIAPRISWSQVVVDGAISDVIADRSRFVAVGGGTDGASAWTSQNGRSWVEHDVPERSFGEVDEGIELTASPETLVRLQNTLYAFGSMSFMDAVAGAGWRWTDDEAWQVIESGSPIFQGRVTAAAADSEALVAATISFTSGLFGSYTTWRWTPATSWTPTMLSSSENQVLVVEAIAWSSGTFVAAGSSAAAVEGAERWDWPPAPALWTSPDGVDWTPSQLPAGLSHICALGPSDDGFVAFGAELSDPAAWTSRDGARWTRRPVDESDAPLAFGDIDYDACKVLDIGEGLAVVATVADGTLLWTSHDGEEWTFQERLPIKMTAAAALDRRVVVAGLIRRSTDGETSQPLLVGTVEP